MIRAQKAAALLAGSALLLTTACTSPEHLGGTDPNRKAKEGALIGGFLGAISGAMVSKDEKKGAIVGAALGAGVGAAIGNNLDKQEAELRDSLDGNVGITNTGDRLIVTMPQDILFATDSTYVQDGLRDDLQTVASSLNRYPDTTVQVVGHTDNTGSAAYNQDLSQRRAAAVGNILIGGGVSSGRVQIIGRGEESPIATNLNAAGRAQNRRVEIVILPN
ncbi:OmpA family protein [Thalassovita sp.]|uniref:OmpA family protein n=1 Tax=Thalassovita sp. TaxID=1979401 RepID=UPI0028811316|nr:OmpA family protein [Thalassovita sp.]MDF1802350.1 OmpA family protein [Thalassovita sp.]